MSRKPIARSSRPIPRKARIKNRGRSRFPKRRCPEYLAWLKEQPCCITGRSTGCCVDGEPGNGGWYYHVTVDPAHVRARGAGHPDLWNALSLAHHLHDELHARGIRTFEKKYGVDLQKLAEQQTEEFLRLHPEFGDHPGDAPPTESEEKSYE